MAERVVAALLPALGTLAVSEFTLLTNFDRAIRWLQDDLRMMNDALTEAEVKKYKDKSVETWLPDLRDVRYDIVDVLDELKTETALYPNLQSHTDDGIAVSFVRQLLACFLSCFTLTPNPVLFRHKMVSRIKGIYENLKALAARVEIRRVLLPTPGQVNQSETSNSRQTSSTPSKDVPFSGRDLQKQQLLDTLCATATPDHRVPLLVPIVGLGGIGKTTLAQAVFNDGRVKECFPMCRKWVFVGEKFDACKIIEQLLSKDSGKESDTGRKSSLEDLDKRLSSEIRDKKFLIILDDVWSEKSEEWSQIWRPLEDGGQGSIVIVTTRSPQVAKMKGPVPLTITLEPLSTKKCWSIFEKGAFVCKSPEEYPEMKEIGLEIVEKLKGIPLAAKLIGEALGRNFDRTYWKRLMDSDIWLQELEREDVLPSLLLSYQALPSHLKPCFAFCSLFPKDHEFDRETLVWMWMAHDFIQPVGSERMQDVGRRCFDELLQRSFLQSIHKSYVMHDLIHDLAEFVSRGECLRVEDEKKPCSIPDSVHHISVHFDRGHVLEPKYLNQLNRAQTLMRSTGSFTVASDQNFCRLLGRLKSLRVLDLRRCSFLWSLPEEINNLKHLRYLDITDTGIRKLPESLCMLYNLQTLRVDNYCELPKAMSKLVNLRHVDADPIAISEIAGIGKLTCLQELKGPFRVLSEHVKQGRSIRELRSMNQLGGTLRICNLEEVGSAEEAAEARLKDKQFLHGLELVYGGGVFKNQDAICEQVMEALQPPRQIKELTLLRYPGSQPPTSLPPTLLQLDINKCPNLQSLPTSLPPTLEKLAINKCPEVQSLPTSLPPILLQLDINKCPKLQSLPTSLPHTLQKLTINECSNLLSFSTSLPHTLQKLVINECPNLQSLPTSLPRNLKRLEVEKCSNLQSLPTNFPSTLQYLRIEECRELQSLPTILPRSLLRVDIIKCPNIQSLPDSLPHSPPSFLQWLSRLQTQRKFTINECPKLQSLPTYLPRNLTELVINECPNLQSPPTYSTYLPRTLRKLVINEFLNLQSLPTELPLTLKQLDINKCPNLQSLPTSLPPTLRYLWIKECPTLQFLPTSLPPSLQQLHIQTCPNLQSLPTSLPPTLKQLRIKECPNLQSLLAALPSTLVSLTIQEFPNLQALLSIPPSMQRLEIVGCPRLEKVAWLKVEPDLIGSSSSTPSPSSSPSTGPVELYELTTDSRRLLSWLLLQPRRLDSLQSLVIRDGMELETFTKEEKEGWHRNFSSLSSLSFRGCPNLLSLPEGLPVEPKIRGCPEFQSDELLTFWNWGNVLGALKLEHFISHTHTRQL